MSAFTKKYGADSDEEYSAKGEKCPGGGYYKKGGKLMALKKSNMQVTADALEKSLDQLGQFVQSNSPEDRKNMLLRKSLDGGELSDAEKTELFQLMGTAAPAPVEPEGESLSKSMNAAVSNDKVADVLDVSEYISSLHEGLTKALDIMGDRVDSTSARQNEFNLVLARAVGEVGKMVKSLGEQVEQLSAAPARGPKSRGTPAAAVIQKSFGPDDGPPAEERMTKSQLLEGLMDIVGSKGPDTRIHQQPASFWVTRVESTSAPIPKQVVQEVKQHIQR